jgi:hypothetical protein
MSVKARAAGQLARASLFLVGVCVGIPVILFEYLSVTLGGTTIGILA